MAIHDSAAKQHPRCNKLGDDFDKKVKMYYVSVECIKPYVTSKTSSRYRYLNICLSNILIFTVQQAMIAAPNLTSKESRKEWEIAFSSSVVTLTLKVCLPLIFGSLNCLISASP